MEPSLDYSYLTKVNNAAYIGEAAQFWREELHIRVETLIGGTMVEKSSLTLYRGDGSPFSLCYVLDFKLWVCKSLHPRAV